MLPKKFIGEERPCRFCGNGVAIGKIEGSQEKGYDVFHRHPVCKEFDQLMQRMNGKFRGAFDFQTAEASVNTKPAAVYHKPN